jgi:uncharacterized membrane protein YjgN (DUF898 family)
MENVTKQKTPILVKILVSLISLVFSILGLVSIMSEHYYGHTSKFGGHEVVKNGNAAILIGIGMILMGLSPLALWAKSAKTAGWWVALCLIFGLLFSLSSIYVK